MPTYDELVEKAISWAVTASLAECSTERIQSSGKIGNFLVALGGMRKVLAKAKGKMQIQGPYKSTKWLDRLMNLESIFLILQIISFLALAAITGFEWISSGQYLKFTLIFGGSALSLFLVWLTRSHLFMLTACAIALAGALWH